MCKQCGSLLSPTFSKLKVKYAAASFERAPEWFCLTCRETDGSQKKDSICEINMPHVFKYLVAELAAMNIKVNLDLKSAKA